jgi:hypothetical protein
MQKRASGAAAWPQAGQVLASEDPQAMQKRAIAGLATPH